MTTLATLQSYLELEYHITAHCLDCAHFARLDTHALIARFGEGFNVVARRDELVAALRCERCGSRRITTRIASNNASRSQMAGRDGMKISVELEASAAEVVATVSFVCNSGHSGQKSKAYPLHGPLEDYDREPVSERAIQAVASDIARICNCETADVLDANGRFLQERFHDED